MWSRVDLTREVAAQPVEGEGDGDGCGDEEGRVGKDNREQREGSAAVHAGDDRDAGRGTEHGAHGETAKESDKAQREQSEKGVRGVEV